MSTPALSCPRCGSRNLSTSSTPYNTPLGCLGALLFGWWGLLAGLLGAGQTKLICLQCGHSWPLPKTSSQEGFCGCLFLIFIIFLICVALGGC